MKKFITLDEAAICFFSATGYGLGLLIPEFFGMSIIVNIICCFALGIFCEEIAEHIVFSKFVQINQVRRVFSWIIMIAIFFIASTFSIKFLGENLNDDLIEEFEWLIGAPFVSFIISSVVFFIKKHIILKRYGNGQYTYVFSRKAKKYIQGLNGENKEIKGDYDKSISVSTKTGTYVPNQNKDILEFLGIPYAKPPVGNLRYKKTSPLEQSDKVFEAKYFGTSAPQANLEGNILKYHNQSEDCLTLNIWMANNDIKDKPVIVYFPGSSFIAGGSANVVGDGEYFIRDNPEFIFVSINYRLGEFGFKDNSNLGLYDQIEALRWINQNIGSFGGDAKNITLLGDTTGATCIMLLCTAQDARGLFNRVIAMSSLLEYDNVQFEFAPRPDGKLIPKDAYDNFEKYVDENMEFMFGLPTEELGHVGGILGKEISEEMREHYWDLYIKKLNKEQVDFVEKLQEKKHKIFNTEDKAFYFIEFLLFHYFPLDIANRISKKNKTYCFQWDASSGVKNFEANSNSFLATLLKNKQAGEETGFIIDKNLHAILNALIKKYLNSESLELFNNEIVGVRAIDWARYNVKNKQVLSFKNDRIELIKDYMNDEFELIDKL